LVSLTKGSKKRIEKDIKKNVRERGKYEKR
jgi:hypothetical protein